MSLKEKIRFMALDLGFSACGFANIDYDPVLHSRFVNWLDCGFHADMDYLKRGHRHRFDPRIHMPQAKSAIVCALNYYSEPAFNARMGYISLYARAEDYHAVVEDKLEKLSKNIKILAPSAKLKTFVDSRPISEKSMAVKAGLGFIGKNDLLILSHLDKNTGSAARGSFHFLGLIVADIELEFDLKSKRNCGSCRRCIDACPTGAILADRLIDANKCIAYHTIENTGTIPSEIAIRMKNVIYGCDICQLACPYNRGHALTTEPRFAPDPDLVNIDMDKIRKMGETEFKTQFKSKKIGQAGYNLIMRNIDIVMHNIISGKEL